MRDTAILVGAKRKLNNSIVNLGVEIETCVNKESYQAHIIKFGKNIGMFVPEYDPSIRCDKVG